jgi:hypothetical protein
MPCAFLTGRFSSLAEHTPTDEATQQLASLGRAVQERYGRLVVPHLVVTTASPPADSVWNDSVLMDREQFAHTTYGITGPCLYLVRPDWYVGFRGPLSGGEALLAYLHRIAV